MKLGKRANFKREYNQLLNSQCHFGESKHLAKQKLSQGEHVRGIYSKTTLRTYQKSCEQFSSYLRENHPEVKKFIQGKPYIAEWLESLKDSHSAWTLATYASGVCSAYQIPKEDIDFDFPKRKRENIIRSRTPLSYHDSDPKYDDVRLFCLATGARRIGAIRVRKSDIRQKEDGTYEVFFREKNNMEGWRQVLPQYQEQVLRIFNDSPGYKTPNGELRLFRKNSFPQELHSNRAAYAKELYLYYEELGTYTTGEKYYCRGDMAGLVLDKGILKQVSEQLFHHRLDVVVSNYLYLFKS